MTQSEPCVSHAGTMSTLAEAWPLWILIAWNFAIAFIGHLWPDWERMLMLEPIAALQAPDAADTFLLATVQFLRLFSYTFIHADTAHLMTNMLWLALFGYAFAKNGIHRMLMWLYFCGGCAGGIFYLLSAYIWPQPNPLCGASAAVLAVMAAAWAANLKISICLRKRKKVSLRWIAVIAILPAIVIFTYPATLAAHIGGLSGGSLIYYLMRQK